MTFVCMYGKKSRKEGVKMDETFIKMCKEATEIQEQKELIMDSGDLVINKSNHPHPSFVFCVNETVELDPDKFDWLPRQEDLQKIHMKFAEFPVQFRFECPDDPMGFNYYYRTENKTINPSITDLNTLWLCFVMETCYNKRWNGNTWEVI